MQLAYAMLAEAATVGQDGKLSVLGGEIDRIHPSAFPALHAPLSLVVRLTPNASEIGSEHQFRVEINTPDGLNMLPGGVAPFTPQPTGKLVFVINFPPLMFPVAGMYQIRILVDGDEIGTLPLELRLVAPPQNVGNGADDPPREA